MSDRTYTSLALDLDAPDAEVRWRAAAVLAEQPGEEAEKLLISLLGDPDYRVRERAAAALGRRFTTRVAEACTAGLGDEANAGRRAASLAVLSRAGEAGRTILLKALGDASPDVRLAAAQNLPGARSDEATVAALEAASRHEADPNTRAALLLALGRTGRREAIPALLAALEEGSLWLRVHALEALGDVGDPDVVPRLLPLLEHQGLRRATLRTLARVRSSAPAEELARRAAAGEDDGDVLAALRGALATSAPGLRARVLEIWPEAPERLLEHVKNADAAPSQRTDAAALAALLDVPGTGPAIVHAGPLADGFETLRALPFARFDETLMAALQSEDPEPALALVAWARGAGDPARLAPLLVHTSPVVRGAVLGVLPSGSASPSDLIDQLADDDPETALPAALALAAAAADSTRPERARACRAALLDRSQGSDGPGRTAVLLALGPLEGPEVDAALRRALGATDPAARAAALAALSRRPTLGAAELEPHLQDADAEVRAAALRALSRIAPEGPPTWRDLLPLLADEPLVAAAAGEAIVARAGDERARLAGELLAQDDAIRRAAIEAIGRSGDAEALAAVAHAASHEDGETARAVVEALAEAPDELAAEPLSHALEDSRPEVRRAAAEAVARRPSPTAWDSLVPAALAVALAGEADPYVLAPLLRAVAVAGGPAAIEPLTLHLASDRALPGAEDAARALASRFPADVRRAWAAAPARAERVWSRALGPHAGGPKKQERRPS